MTIIKFLTKLPSVCLLIASNEHHKNGTVGNENENKRFLNSATRCKFLLQFSKGTLFKNFCFNYNIIDYLGLQLIVNQSIPNVQIQKHFKLNEFDLDDIM